MAYVTMKDMLDAGVHFGHQTQRWNPKMKPYVYTDRGGIHIIDLQKSVVSARAAYDFVKETAATGVKVIFVGTKKQAIEPIREAAEKSGQFHVTKRWLGGTLTNFQTVKASIDRLKRIDQMREKGEMEFFSKKERARMEKEYIRLNEYLSGIRDMKDAPGLMFVVDLNKEHIAVAEAFLEGAKEFEATRRNSVDKQEKEEKKVEEKPTREKAASAAGPAVVKVSKGRKLVAAGTADEVEIEMELEAGETEKTEETDETTES